MLKENSPVGILSATGFSEINDDELLQNLIDFIFNLCKILQNAETTDIIYFNNSETKLILSEFMNEITASTIFVSKIESCDTQTNEESLDIDRFRIMTQLEYFSHSESTIVIIKEKGKLSRTISFDKQMQILNLPNISKSINENEVQEDTSNLNSNNKSLANRRKLYEMLRNLVSLGIYPYFENINPKNISTEASSSDNDNFGFSKKIEDDSSILNTKKKFNELTLSLLNILESIQVPDLLMSVHPAIKAAVQQAIKQEFEQADSINKKITVDPISFLDKSLLSDSQFLNSLQNVVNNWVKSVKDIAYLTKESVDATVIEEVNFWSNIEIALLAVQDQLQSREIVTTLDILRTAKKFYATVSLLSDTGLKSALELAINYNQLLKDLPIDDLLSAQSFTKIEQSIILIMNHLKKLRVSAYPIPRALQLVEAMTFDVDKRIKYLLSASTSVSASSNASITKLNLMTISYDEFLQKYDEIKCVLNTLDKQIKEFTNLAREILRKRSEKFIFIKINSFTKNINNRLDYICDFRRKHYELVFALGNIMNNSSMYYKADSDMETMTDNKTVDMASDPVSQIEHAYEAVELVDISDTSIEGENRWIAAESLYNQRAENVELQVTEILNESLFKAKTTSEMYLIFVRFKFLLSKNSSSWVVQEFQKKLLELSLRDIENLQKHFLKQDKSLELIMSKDIAENASIIIWAKKISNQLNILNRRLEIIFGPNWSNINANTQKIFNEASVLQKKLNIKQIYNNWLTGIETSSVTKNLSEPILKICFVERNSTINSYKLEVNFDLQSISLFKEVRNFCNLSFPVPHKIISISRTIRKVYPFVVNLQECMHMLNYLLLQFDKLNDFQVLLIDEKLKLFKLISKCIHINWEEFLNAYDFQKKSLTNDSSSNTPNNSFLVDTAVDNVSLKLFDRLIVSTSKFDNKIKKVGDLKKSFTNLLVSLTDCDYSYNSFKGILLELQEIVNKLILQGFNNIKLLVSKSNEIANKVLNERLKAYLNSIDAISFDYYFTETKHEIILKNSTIVVAPSVETTKAKWFKDIQHIVDVIRLQKKLKSDGYDIQKNLLFQEHFEVLQFDLLIPIMNLINSKFKGVYQYACGWYRFQTLWDLPSEKVFNSIGSNIDHWIKLLNEINQSRHVFDTIEKSKKVNGVTFDYEQIQIRINDKYDSWQKEIILKFTELLSSSMKTLYNEIIDTKKYLEQNTVNISFMNETIALISKVQTIKTNTDNWKSKISSFQKACSLLTRKRYSFPSDWLYVDQVENEYLSLAKILKIRNAQIDAETSILVKTISVESQKLNNKSEHFMNDWSSNKPISGALVPSQALSILNDFEDRVNEIEKKRSLLVSSIKVFKLAIIMEHRISHIREEIADLKSVWSSIQVLYNPFQEMRQLLWTNVSTRDIRRQLDGLLLNSRSMPSKVRQYTAFVQLQNNIKMLLKQNSIISSLKSDAIKERHWNEIFKTLDTPIVAMGTIRLGDIWDLQLLLNETLVKNIVTKANSEKAVESSLDSIKKTWSDMTLSLFSYKDKCRLVKGWDGLFKQCTDDIDTLTAMRNSNYYPIFEHIADPLETRLGNLYTLLDVWIDLQRQYVYLDGVFGDNKDIKRLLPTETSRFMNVTSDYFKLLKIIYKSPFVIDIIQINDIQSTMERYLEVLGRVKRALGNFLEKQRELFPRFYFLGNDDLLNIIGNADDPTYVGSYLNKVYNNIYGLVVNGSAITAVKSKEDEVVALVNVVAASEHDSLVSWLIALESELKRTLLRSTINSFESLNVSCKKDLSVDPKLLLSWIREYPGQCLIVSLQLFWTQSVETAIENNGLGNLKVDFTNMLSLCSLNIIDDLPIIDRRKLENLIIELSCETNCIQELCDKNVTKINDFTWRSKIRYYYNPTSEDFMNKITVSILDASYHYGFEYSGLLPNLVRNDIIEGCFINYSETLRNKKGGCSFGPAGTGKTESVKEFAKALGRPVNVFNCDESFDFTAISRILLGVCQIGSFVCFDEFNRLEKNILSSVSSQLEKIELALSNNDSVVDLLGKTSKLNSGTSIFITINPTYEGRSTLPENLKKLFRNYSINKANKESIAEVILLSQGFKDAKLIARKIIQLFDCLEIQLSKQLHYDFGLRSVKSTLRYCGQLKRKHRKEPFIDEISMVHEALLISLSPKFIYEDLQMFKKLLVSIFGNTFEPIVYRELEHAIEDSAKELHFKHTNKITELYNALSNNNGIIMVGDSGTGKTTSRKILLRALHKLDSVETIEYVINPKVPKDVLYGSLDLTTREFKDGIFTNVLRKIVENLRGELSKRIWVVFDGDVDPEWIENLNSLLDDNKIFTLPNGEHISLPLNVKLIFETDSLKHATPATVSRCGMIFFSNTLIGYKNIFDSLILNFLNCIFEDSDDESSSKITYLKSVFIDILQESLFSKESETFESIYDKAISLNHVFEFLLHQKCTTLMCIYTVHFKRFASLYLKNSSLFEDENIKSYCLKALLLSIFWSFAGDCQANCQRKFNDFICSIFNVDLSEEVLLSDYTIKFPEMTWCKWSSLVTSVELNTNSINEQIIIPTADTVRLESFIDLFLEQDKFLILCGPPGSGKTMSILNYLSRSNKELISINFSGKTTIDDLMSSFLQYCTYDRGNAGIVLRPKSDKELVCFIDEINLPNLDSFGSQPVISFLREIVEENGFRSTEKSFVKLEKIKFIAACNLPTDVGRNKLSPRFLNLCSVLFIGYPGKDSLEVIYNSLVTNFIEKNINIRPFANIIVESILSIYYRLKDRIDIISPRDLTRFSRSIFVGVKDDINIDMNQFLRLFTNECLRLFSDRIGDTDLKNWIFQVIHDKMVEHFSNCDESFVFKRPILYSNWLSTAYSSVDLDEYKSFVYERLKVFSNEVLDTNLILYEDCLDHIARIDRALSLTQGHLILVGTSTSGKTTLCQFVAWVNGFETIQLSVHKKFGLSDFDNILRALLKKTGANGDKVCFIIDESNILEASFIERMNTLLANCEVPSLFSPSEFSELMEICKELSKLQGLLLETNDELYQWFKNQISLNLKVIFTLGGNSELLSSPALLNRCTINYMGDWKDETLTEVATNLISALPVSNKSDAINALIDFHRLTNPINIKMGNFPERVPGQFMEFLLTMMTLYTKKEAQLQSQQRHINVGLDKIRDTVIQVKHLKENLSKKQAELYEKDLSAKKMLDKMLIDQNEAERKQEASLEVQEALKMQDLQIRERKKEVDESLSSMIPIIEAAAQNVKNIKKQNLSELRSMNSPPEAVKMALEAVCILLGFGTDISWHDIQKITRRDDFIISILNFKNNIDPVVRNLLETKYFSKPNFTLATVSRASKACGPLLSWIEAQVRYSAVLEQVDPLKGEVNVLENSSKTNEAKLLAINEMVEELEQSIEKYKVDYSNLIRETENIKTSMRQVENKISRSLALIESLTEERKRWSKMSFQKERENLPGNCILSAAFMTYGGFFDQMGRHSFLKLWKTILANKEISFDENLLLREFLSTANEILEWQENGLIKDDLYTENIIIVKHSEMYPYIIDPLGDIVKFLKSSFSKRKVVTTSFLDTGFLKHVENAMRFGSSVIIEDAEYFDPVIACLLKKEFTNAGGRRLIKVGNQEIDCAPEFKLYLHTKNPLIMIPSHISGRTTIVNFSTTKNSLETNVLNMSLLTKEPEIELKRQNLIKLNGEYKAHLRELEENLLLSLSKSDASILEDNDLVTTLETLKSESQEIQDKMKETFNVMNMVEKISEKYYPLARLCSYIYAVLSSVGKLSPFYRFTLNYFLQIVEVVLKMTFDGDDESKIFKFIIELFKLVYKRSIVSLKLLDKSVFTFSLYSAYLQTMCGGNVLSVLSDICNLFSKDKMNYETIFKKIQSLVTDDSAINFSELNDDNVDEFLENIKPDSPTYELKTLLSMLLIENSLDFSDQITSVFKNKFALDDFDESEQADKILGSIATKSTPVILSTSESFDPSFKVENVSKKLSKKMVVISMGSLEAIEIANKHIKKAAADGYWILIQNAHMAPDWLDYLTKAMSSMNIHENFKLVLTCYLDSLIPNTLLSASHVLTFENVRGLKSVLRETYNSIPQRIQTEYPIEKRHVLFILSWYHSIIVERSRYIPIGWKINHNFNNTDFEFSLNIIDRLITSKNNRSNIAPETFPWSEINYLIGNIAYGGKINNVEDSQELLEFTKFLFNAKVFDSDFNLIDNEKTRKKGLILNIPESSNVDDYIKWIDDLPATLDLSWLNLEDDVEEIVKLHRSKKIAGLSSDIIQTVANF